MLFNFLRNTVSLNDVGFDPVDEPISNAACDPVVKVPSSDGVDLLTLFKINCSFCSRLKLLIF